MVVEYTALVAGCLSLLTAGVVERHRHRTSLNRVPVRVLVNGTRGKSSITRLCAGALRGDGKQVLAKTTGSAARLVYPDGTERPVNRRFGVANVAEQIGVVRQAAALDADALVVECMALDPELQEVSQTLLVQSTIGVVCNVRADHLEEMGPTRDDVARSLCRSMPVGGVCVTAERDRVKILREEAARRHCRLVEVDPDAITDEDLVGFPTATFKENVAVALGVAELLGVERNVALAGMRSMPPGPGSMTVEDYRTRRGRLRFVNLFAANDPDSTLQSIRHLADRSALPDPVYLLVNCRPERIERNAQMGALVPDVAPRGMFLIGEPTRSARRAIPREWRDRVVDLGGRRFRTRLLASVLAEIEPDATLVAVGNLHGRGEAFMAELAVLEPVGALSIPASRRPPDEAERTGEESLRTEDLPTKDRHTEDRAAYATEPA